MKRYGRILNNYEKGEILDYPEVYWIGVGSRKISPKMQMFSIDKEDEELSGYDDER